MIIPVRCFTCNRLLADKWAYYERKCREIDAAAAAAAGEGEGEGEGAASAAEPPSHMSPRGKLLDELGLRSICCRRHMLTHVDLIDVI